MPLCMVLGAVAGPQVCKPFLSLLTVALSISQGFARNAGRRVTPLMTLDRIRSILLPAQGTHQGQLMTCIVLLQATVSSQSDVMELLQSFMSGIVDHTREMMANKISKLMSKIDNKMSTLSQKKDCLNANLDRFMDLRCRFPQRGGAYCCGKTMCICNSIVA
ncbi:hypothetical protein PoB_004249900 [Plakobranchus ocellatus]|uniref:Uncharacterized protein n=1 Tax=Plakobranchus ocellatus TaxID=259542 RepID=A0AAV4B7H2_9GAST|nr:hypothetical protein PoB_004249900 [Plakobranchus ocellatus]